DVALLRRLFGLHVAQGRPAAEERAREVERERLVPELEGRLDDAAPLQQAARVRDEDVEVTEGLDGLLDDPIALPLEPEIGLDGQRLAPSLLELGDRLGRVARRVRDGYVCALGRQGEGDALADARGAA